MVGWTPLARAPAFEAGARSELAEELPLLLRIGIGLHVGTAVVGILPSGESGSLQFLGDKAKPAD